MVVLTNLGIQNANGLNHRNYFHVYLRPPGALEIGGKALTSAAAAPHSDITATANAADFINTYIEDIDGMDIQLLETLPQVQISLAAGERGAVTMPHITFCKDVDSSPNAAAESAWNDFSVFMRGEMLKPKEISKYAVALVEAPKHGNVVFTDRARTTVDATPKAAAQTTLMYRSEVGYLGADSATFQVDSRGRKYLVTVNFLVLPSVTENSNGRFECTAAGMDKKASPSEANTSALQQLNLVAQASGVVSLSQSESSSELAYVVGNGSAATINLSPTAAGRGWYLDPTPLDNSDDFLPTADTTIWRAKAGSAADGKMDMLSVLLHEYGHVLGLEHSADSRDFMAATLQPGERRLPTADELAWMAQRVAEIKAAQEAGGSVSAAAGSSLGDLPADPSQPLRQPQPGYPAWGTLGTAMRLARRGAAGVAGSGVVG